MCDFLKNLFGGGEDNSALMQMFHQQRLATDKANTLAEDAAKSAKEQAAAALASPADSEQARQASERRIRRLLQTGGGAGGTVQALGAAPVSYRVLMGT